MDLLELLNSFQEALFELAMWLVLIPKTLYRVVLKPGDLPVYVKEQIALEKNRFEDLMPPVLFWLVLTVIPGFFITRYTTHALDKIPTESTVGMIVYLSVAFSAVIMAPCILIQAFSGGRYTKEAMRGNFYLQCYVQTPFTMIAIVCCLLMKHYGYDFDAMDKPDYQFVINRINGSLDLLILPIMVALGWLVWAQIKVIKAQTGKGTGNAFLILALSYFLWVLLFVPTLFIGFVLKDF